MSPLAIDHPTEAPRKPHHHQPHGAAASPASPERSAGSPTERRTMRPPIPPTQPAVKRTSHTFHLIMSVITLGIWALFVWWWVAMVINHGNAKRARQYALELAEY